LSVHDHGLESNMSIAVNGHQSPSLQPCFITIGDHLDRTRNRGTQCQVTMKPGVCGLQEALVQLNLQQPCSGLYSHIVYCTFLYLSYVTANYDMFETIHIVSIVAALNTVIPLQSSHRPQQLSVFIQRSFHKRILHSTVFLTCSLSEIKGPWETLLYNAFTNRSHKVRVRSVWSTTHPPQPSNKQYRFDATIVSPWRELILNAQHQAWMIYTCVLANHARAALQS
jgi:hypothetical protein